MRLEISKHAEKRLAERYTADTPVKELFAKCKVCKSTMLRYIRMKCKKHLNETRRESDYIFWYAKDKKNKIWRILVTKALNPREYILVTYFELDYTEFYP